MRDLVVLVLALFSCGGAVETVDAGTDAGRDAGFCFPVTQLQCWPDGDGGLACHWESRPCPR